MFCLLCKRYHLAGEYSREGDFSGQKQPKPAPSAEPDPDEEEGDPGPYFCVCCDVANVTKCDEDRCCVECGFDLVPLSQIQALLSRAGLAIVPAADVPSAEDQVSLQAIHCATIVELNHERGFMGFTGIVAEAELARRAAKEKP